MTYTERLLKARSDFKEFMKCYPFSTGNLDGECWQSIKEYEGIYFISNYGRVKSLKHRNPRILKPLLFNCYLSVQLFTTGEVQICTVHRLVAKAFIPNPDNKPQVNHINGCKFDNSVTNLEWTTCAENVQHAFSAKLNPSGENVYNAKFTNEQIFYVRNNPDGLNTIQLAAMFGTASETISKIQLGKTYKRVGGLIRESQKGGLPRLPDEIRKQIRKLYIRKSSEFGSPALAKRFNCSQTTILNIINEK